MIKNIIGKLINSNSHKISQIEPIVQSINNLESQMQSLSDEDIKLKTQEWKDELHDKNLTYEQIQKRLDEILPQAYALVRETSKRVMNQRHRDVQLLAGIALHQGKIAEQKTGEGKTLTATLALYLNSLPGRGAHLITPNDYLSKHGAGWYGPLYEKLGLTVGVVTDQKSYVYDSSYIDEGEIDQYSRHLKVSSRKEAYSCDVTYGTNSQFGFDYLRDNMVTSVDGVAQTNPINEYWAQNFAIVDEVDSVLIDFARTPLIISTQRQEETSKYVQYSVIAETLVKKTDYTVDEKFKSVTLTELGINKLERKLDVKNLYETDFDTIRKIENALRAKELYEKDRDYVVKNGEIFIVDQFTGRILIGNRWSDGLHQAVEAKEKVEIKSESKTIATVSYQNYFRLYKKLAGMTGTAVTEAEEFFKIYSLDVISIPTNKTVARKDQPDLIYKTETAKYRAMAKDISERYKKGQPVLIGTVSVDKSQLLSTYLKKLKIPHQILNAKHHDKEAQIIAQAGKFESVTVSTNMAGRGVDIILGGDPYNEDQYKKVVDTGGLYVIGTERHESRRIDNQLRGRSGRQGDPGESRFYLSLQDDLMRNFGGEKIEAVMNTLKVDEGTPIESRIISKAIEGAQKKVESFNFDARRGVVDYDDVMNVQRETVYSLRRKLINESNENPKDFIEWITGRIQERIPNSELSSINESNINKHGEVVWADVISKVTLEIIDVMWMDHIDTMDDLRTGVRLRGYGQVDPLVEYKREGRKLFDDLELSIWNNAVDRLSKIQVNVVYENPIEKVVSQSNTEEVFQKDINYGVLDEANASASSDQLMDRQNAQQTVVKAPRPGRNEKCWCGSGKKYKNCHWPE